MDNNERIIKIEELKKLKEEVINNIEKEQNNSGNIQNTQSKTKTIGVGTSTGGLNMYPVYEEKKAGMMNVIFLAIMSFIFECIFLALSFKIFS